MFLSYFKKKSFSNFKPGKLACFFIKNFRDILYGLTSNSLL